MTGQARPLELVGRSVTEHDDLVATIDAAECLTWSRYRDRAGPSRWHSWISGFGRVRSSGVHMVDRADHVTSDVGGCTPAPPRPASATCCRPSS